MNNSADETLKELLCGMLCYGAAAQIICLIVDMERLLYTSIGLWIGIGAGALMGVHMKRTIEDALDYDESLINKADIVCFEICSCSNPFWSDYLL